MAVTIECRPNGPYLVKGLENLRNSRNEILATQPVVALCRCGGSANKPFCDATHKKNGFSDARISDGSGDKVEAYEGRRVTVRDNRSICAHAGFCTDGLPMVFRAEGKPWIDPDRASAEAVVATVRKCPSGALSCSIDGVEVQPEPRDPAITVTSNGPYAIVGGIELVGVPWGQGASREHYTLCRCGASKNKPFCDGSHWDSGFRDERN